MVTWWVRICRGRGVVGAARMPVTVTVIARVVQLGTRDRGHGHLKSCSSPVTTVLPLFIVKNKNFPRRMYQCCTNGLDPAS